MADDDQKPNTNPFAVLADVKNEPKEETSGSEDVPAASNQPSVGGVEESSQELTASEAASEVANEDAVKNPERQVSQPTEEPAGPQAEDTTELAETQAEEANEEAERLNDTSNDDPNAKWYVVHTYSGHENKVATALKQRIESEHLEHKILDVIVPTQDKIEIRSGKKATVKEKIFPGYILVKMILDDNSWLAVRTTQGVTSFVGIGNKPTPIPDAEVRTIVKFMTQGAAPTFKDVFMVDDTVKIIDGPFSEFIGKVDSVDKEHGKVRVLVSIFGRETPVELDFLQVQKL